MAKKTDAPKIEYPCPNYPIKVLGQTASDYQSFVVDIVRTYSPDLDEAKISVNESRNGRFTAITLFITATGPDQLEALHKDLIQHERIKVVL